MGSHHSQVAVGILAGRRSRRWAAISNCFKHAFAPAEQGKIHLALQPLPENGQVRLCVRDNGRGLPADFATRRNQSLGLKMVEDLSRQIGGTLEIGANADFCVHFTPDNAKTHRIAAL